MKRPSTLRSGCGCVASPGRTRPVFEKGAATVLVPTGGTDTDSVVLTTNGTALSGVDFVPVNERFVFEPGETRKGIVPLLDDSQVEPAETIELVLSNPSSGTTLVRTNVTAVIYDDEIPANLDLNFAPVFNRRGELLGVGSLFVGKVSRAADRAITGIVDEDM